MTVPMVTQSKLRSFACSCSAMSFPQWLKRGPYIAGGNARRHRLRPPSGGWSKRADRGKVMPPWPDEKRKAPLGDGLGGRRYLGAQCSYSALSGQINPYIGSGRAEVKMVEANRRITPAEPGGNGGAATLRFAIRRRAGASAAAAMSPSRSAPSRIGHWLREKGTRRCSALTSWTRHHSTLLFIRGRIGGPRVQPHRRQSNGTLPHHVYIA